MSSTTHDAVSTAEELVARGDLRGAIDVMIEANSDGAGLIGSAGDANVAPPHARALADLDAPALARVAAGMGLTAMMRAARGDNAAIATTQALLLIELADRELLERVLGGRDRLARLVGTLEAMRGGRRS